MTVRVYSGSVLVEMKVFIDEKKALAYADFWQDDGFRVRISEN